MPSFKERLLASLDASDSDLMTRDYAEWLLSDIESDVWHMRFGKSECSIQWGIRFGQSLLTAPEHAPLLRTFKYWLLVQTHPLCCGRRPAVNQVAYNKVTQALRLLDYMLIHEKQWGLSQFGFRAVSANDILNMLFAFETYSADEKSIYDWDNQLSNYLIKKGGELTDELLFNAISRVPSLSIVELPKEDWTLSVTRDELIKGRAYLWLNGYYKKEKRLDYKYSPETKKLADEIYRNTLWGKSPKSIHEELCFDRFESYIREYEGVDVRTSVGEDASERGFSIRKRTLLTLPLLSKFDCEVPESAIKHADALWISVPENFRAAGRFRPPSFWEVMDTFRKGTEFVLRYGYELVTSYHNVLQAAAQANTTVVSFVANNDVRDFLTLPVKTLGAKVWALRTSIALPLGYPIRNANSSARVNASEYFPRFRNNEGVIDLLEVMCGAIQQVSGALTARRQSELRLLPKVGALDAQRRFITFRNAKSGWSGLRAIEARPIPSLAADFIGILEHLHKGMPVHKNKDGNREKGRHEKEYLFSLPGERGELVYGISAYNGALDALCDYFETPLDGDGRRSYIRQHQLRKFFVITFFYGSSYSSLDTLRWFLGHSDAEYLWNYITSQIPGDMLRSIQATFLVDKLTDRANGDGPAPVIEINEQNLDSLESLVLERFGTKMFTLIDSAALEDYVTLLLKRGLKVEPQFFNSTDGKRYVMAVTIGKGARL